MRETCRVRLSKARRDTLRDRILLPRSRERTAGGVSPRSGETEGDLFSRRYRYEDRVDNSVNVFGNVGIPETHHAPAATAKERIAASIVCALLGTAVRIAVEFDDELRAEASKVGNVCTDGMLTSKTIALVAETLEFRPQACLGSRELAAHTLGISS